jgi:hypothetical protein
MIIDDGLRQILGLVMQIMVNHVDPVKQHFSDRIHMIVHDWPGADTDAAALYHVSSC